MDKYYSDIIGTEIITEAGTHGGFVTDLVIEPETGKLLGFIVGLKKRKVLTPADVLYWSKRLVIHELDVIFDLDEIIKIEKTLKQNIPILFNKVVTRSGEYLGYVYDFCLNDKLFILSKILVTKSFLGVIHYERKIIPHQHILEITRNMIKVKDPIELIPVREKKGSLKAKLRVDIVPSGCISND